MLRVGHLHMQLRGLVALGLALPAFGDGDAQSLLQTDVQAGQAQLQQLLREGALSGRMALLARLAAEMPQGSEPQTKKPRYNCAAFPDFCREPFGCENGKDPMRPVVAKGGKSNLRSWCAAPQYYPYITTCIQKHDLVAAAKVQYNWTVAQKRGIEEMDGSYCFIEGHCTNEAVTANTTLEEADKMCDARYGHSGWAAWHPAQEPRALLSVALFGKYSASTTSGFHDPKLTRVFLKMACAMGNFHCDVMYCKETYCKNEYYVNKYKHLEPKTPGHLLKQRFGRF